MDIAVEQQLITRATTPRGILAWAFAVAATPGYGQGKYLGEIGGGNQTAMDAHAEAAWVLRVVDTQPDYLRCLLRASYGHQGGQIARLQVLVCDALPDSPSGLIERVVRDWCGGGKSSERELADAAGMSRGVVAREAGTVHGVLRAWDWLAMTGVGREFRDRGWLP